MVYAHIVERTDKMKYIVLELDGVEYMVLFPKSEKMTHKHMAEAVTGIRVDDPRRHNYWNREFIEATIVSAAFVDLKGMFCHGRSESLNLECRPEIDTALLKSMM
jgi:hypothetical protein